MKEGPGRVSNAFWLGMLEESFIEPLSGNYAVQSRSRNLQLQFWPIRLPCSFSTGSPSCWFQWLNATPRDLHRKIRSLMVRCSFLMRVSHSLLPTNGHRRISLLFSYISWPKKLSRLFRSTSWDLPNCHFDFPLFSITSWDMPSFFNPLFSRPRFETYG
jgi:hypothetical protein